MYIPEKKHTPEEEYNHGFLFNYFEGSLSEAEEEQLLQWLQTDASNKQVFAEMTDWWAIAHAPQFVSERKQNFEEHFAQLSAQKTVTQHHTLRISFWRNIAISLLALIIVGSISFWTGLRYAEQAQITRTPTGEDTQVVSLLGSVTKVVLPDGSQAWLNAGSTLAYGANYNKQVREIFLSGEAYFDVMADTIKPFIVQSNHLDIRVTGTRFNVKVYEGDETADVSLVSGTVDVLVNNGTEQELFLLSPNQMLSLEKKKSNITVVDINAVDAIAWSNGNMKFSKQPFTRLAKDLERKFNVRIDIESSHLSNEIFSGSFLQHHSLEYILREIDVEKKYTWWWTNDKELIIKDK